MDPGETVDGSLVTKPSWRAEARDLQAVQAHDLASYQKWSATVDADSKKLSNYDETGAENAIKTLFDPLVNEYKRQMTIAAGG